MEERPDIISRPPNALWGYLFSKFFADEKRSQLEILQKIPLFQNLSRRELRTISRIVYERMYEAGEYVFEVNQPGAAMFIIMEGEVSIVLPDKSGKEIELARLKNGEFLGELALLDNSPRSASAFIIKPTKTLAIFREDLDKLLNTVPELGGKVMKKLAVIIGIRLKATNELLMTKEEEKQEVIRDADSKS